MRQVHGLPRSCHRLRRRYCARVRRATAAQRLAHVFVLEASNFFICRGLSVARWIGLHVNAFNANGGPKALVCDNLKAGSRQGKHDVKANQRVDQFLRLRDAIEERASRKFFEAPVEAERSLVLRSNDSSSSCTESSHLNDRLRHVGT
jgi:hypothetical protein